MRRTERCQHGFMRGLSCLECKADEGRACARSERDRARKRALLMAEFRAAQAEAEQLARICCAICEGTHLSKYCPATQTGRRRGFAQFHKPTVDIEADESNRQSAERGAA